MTREELIGRIAQLLMVRDYEGSGDKSDIAEEVLEIIEEAPKCPFCSVACGNDWCAYTEEF